jgi:hypothetical protein
MQTIQSLERVTILGEKTRHWSVQASGGHSESWLQDAPVCPELAHYGMVHPTGLPRNRNACLFWRLRHGLD